MDDIDFELKYLSSSSLFAHHGRSPKSSNQTAEQGNAEDMKALELEAAKEILAEVFSVRLSEVEETIQSRYEAEDIGSVASGRYNLWPQEF